MPDETSRWYARFEQFRLAGPGRSLLGLFNADRLARGQAKQRCVPGAWAQAAKRWRWRDRAEAWDEHERQLARQAHATTIGEMNERQARLGLALQAKGAEGLRALRPEELEPADVLRYFTEGAKLERLGRGQPETVQRQELTGQGGGPVQFRLEDAVKVYHELQEADHGS